MKQSFFPLLIILVGIILSSCNNNDQVEFTPSEPQQKMEYRYLALGDSYTIGERVDTSERWPVQLGKALEKEFPAVVEIEIIATTGWTTRDLISGIEKEEPKGPYDIVTLLIGVNNQYQNRDTSEYRIEFRELLNSAIDLAGGEDSRVIVVSIPDYGVTPFASGSDTEKIAEEIDHFNIINLEETGKTGAAYIDVTAVSRLAAEDLSLLADDGLHPSGKMYGEWVKLILPITIEILNK
jgi:lysophospholipase L1-like esterase